MRLALHLTPFSSGLCLWLWVGVTGSPFSLWLGLKWVACTELSPRAELSLKSGGPECLITALPEWLHAALGFSKTSLCVSGKGSFLC